MQPGPFNQPPTYGAPPASPQSAPSPAPKSSKLALVLGIIAVLGVGAAAAIFITGRSEEDDLRQQLATATAAAATAGLDGGASTSGADPTATDVPTPSDDGDLAVLQTANSALEVGNATLQQQVEDQTATVASLTAAATEKDATITSLQAASGEAEKTIASLQAQTDEQAATISSNAALVAAPVTFPASAVLPSGTFTSALTLVPGTCVGADSNGCPASNSFSGEFRLDGADVVIAFPDTQLGVVLTYDTNGHWVGTGTTAALTLDCRGAPTTATAIITLAPAGYAVYPDGHATITSYGFTYYTETAVVQGCTQLKVAYVGTLTVA